MQAANGEPGSWVSEEAREKFMAAYQRAFARWPQPNQRIRLNKKATAVTRVHAYRPHRDGGAGECCCPGPRLKRLNVVPPRRGAGQEPPGLRGGGPPATRTPASRGP